MKRPLSIAAIVVTIAACKQPLPPESGTAHILLRNRLTIPVTRVYMSNCDAPVDTTDQLSTREDIFPNTERVFDLPSPACYDAAIFTTDSVKPTSERSRMLLQPRDTFIIVLNQPTSL